MKKLKEYAIFKGDEMIAFGNYKDICKKLNISYQTFRHYGTDTYKKRTKEKNARRLICIDDSTEDGELLRIIQSKLNVLNLDSVKNKKKIEVLKEILMEYEETFNNE